MQVAGVDEAGRGPLAGPVVAAVVILNPVHPIHGLKDSKQLSEKQREILYEEICAYSLAFAVGEASVQEIDQINILQATMLAMQRAVMALTIQPDLVLIDGNRIPKIPFFAKAIIQGDQSEPCISAASIIAKVTRDRIMRKMHIEFPHYGFDQHKGYGTKKHLEALTQFGASRIHRQSFAPIKELI